MINGCGLPRVTDAGMRRCVCGLSLGDRRILLRRLLLIVRRPHSQCDNDGYIRSATPTGICASLSGRLPPIRRIDTPISYGTWPLDNHEHARSDRERARRLNQMAARIENVSHSEVVREMQRSFSEI